jgi:hypothetical protein
MPTCRRYLQCPLGITLTRYILEITRLITLFFITIERVFGSRYPRLAIEKFYRLAQGRYTEDTYSVDGGSFVCVALWQNQRLYTFSSGTFGHRQGASNFPQAAIQR